MLHLFSTGNYRDFWFDCQHCTCCVHYRVKYIWRVYIFCIFNYSRYILTRGKSYFFLIVIHCPNGCFHNGDCIGAICFCYPGWTGEDCSRFHCHDLRNCSGNGECVGPNACKCYPGYLVSFYFQYSVVGKYLIVERQVVTKRREELDYCLFFEMLYLGGRTDRNSAKSHIPFER